MLGTFWWKPINSGGLSSGCLYLERRRRKYCPALPKRGRGGVCHLCLLDCSGYKRRLDAFLTNSISSYWRLFLLSFIHQGNVLGVGNSDGTVQLWDVASSKLIRSMAGHTDRVSNLHFNPISLFIFLFNFFPSNIGSLQPDHSKVKNLAHYFTIQGGLSWLESAPLSQRGEGGSDTAAWCQVRFSLLEGNSQKELHLSGLLNTR